MTRFKTLGAALFFGASAAMASTLASPATAQEVISNPGYCAQFYPDANCQNKGPGNPYTGDYQRQIYGQNGTWQNSYNSWDDRYSRWPGDVATGTGPVFAAAPIGADAYARYNGFVCTPGTWFRGEDGRRHPCQ
jgi:hypothetical protein